MKKHITILFLTFIITFNLSAANRGWADIRMAQPLLDVQWSPVQISVWPVSLVPAVDHTYTADIYGLNLNLTTLFHCQNNVYGLSCGVFQTFEKKYGLTVALINGGGKFHGFAAGLANVFSANNGICVGIVNDATNKNPVLTDGKWQRRSVANFLQIGFFNDAHEGVQIGVFNAAEPAEDASTLIQFGLLNHTPNGLLPWMPLFNFSLPKEDNGQ